ncbi:MAG: M28 family peptidase [Gemmatimonadetes bacterium]|uniref:M28 family peptidase n=1 Tax=Candidatus Kutchimonas denitrificans TaxID=3056748 RepID=A0AAE4Z8M8_9BACT|nr:M28 family peptidase [Gemmatimonadota bacterium]NIR74196.1 M28 family peptidase [Candidatus Kutchimonas denitrificans]NIR99818.1 M28 family peptidase [Gemmatimonadota bacterium]NIT65407.1 M28 family peptidase [Gemmatimonadota bacterium]NIU51773.1 M28 family peptidase [Gemmatimonadota bacterium]
MDIDGLLVGVDPQRLERTVRALEGPRHPRTAPKALGEAEALVEAELTAAGLSVERQPFDSGGRTHHNVVGTLPGRRPDRPWLLVGAHFDTVTSTPGADDNASGIAVLLETARLFSRSQPERTVQFVGFNLEEPQDALGRYRVGSARFAKRARKEGRRYAGALVLEMVGYTDRRSGTQQVPPLVFKRVPDSGTFLAAVGDGRSRRLLREFEAATRKHVPELTLVPYRTWLRGWLLPLTRLSDNASFWDRRYPALMITDTAFLRNPHYHQITDSADTLDYEFMARVTRAVLASLAELAENR